jgi:3-mercaptopyruvate sulfurtransferase SseA
MENNAVPEQNDSFAEMLVTISGISGLNKDGPVVYTATGARASMVFFALELLAIKRAYTPGMID